MRRVENLEGRTQELLQRIQANADRRDQLLGGVSAMINDTEALTPFVNDIQLTTSQQLPAYVQASAKIARLVGHSSHIAERNSRFVKRLDLLLVRVKDTKDVADSMMEQSKDAEGVQRVLQSGKLEDAVVFLQRFEEARAVLRKRTIGDASQSSLRDANNASTSNAMETPVKSTQTTSAAVELSPASANVETVMNGAREEVRGMLEKHIRSAIENNDKLGIMKNVGLLAQVGAREEACEMYCTWVGDRTIQWMDGMVSRELNKMDGSSAGAMSHLALVSASLDKIVSAFESEEEFVSSTFTQSGLQKLLQLLHSRCSARCVPVLRDFLRRRKSESADPRRSDRQLEEMSHLVSCCHAYWNFVDRAFQQYAATEQTDPRAGATNTSNSAPRVSAFSDSALFDVVQDILAVYVPMQVAYFDSAFATALKIQLQASNPDSDATNGRGGGYPNGQDNRVYRITLLDDVFIFLRMSLQRALGTRSKDIISSVIIAGIDVIRDKLIPQLKENARRTGDEVPPHVLQWIAVSQRSVSYCKDLAAELRKDAAKEFTGRDLLRFTEQAADMEILGKEFADVVSGWLREVSDACVRTMRPLYDRFLNKPYILTEQVFHYEQSDPWAHDFLVDWKDQLNGMQAFLDASSFDVLLVHAVKSTTATLEGTVLQKQFNAYGALQIDKEFRAIRDFFCSRAKEVSLRDEFSRLTAIVRLLLVDSPRDAVLETADALQPEEKRRVLRRRTDFKPEEIAALKL